MDDLVTKLTADFLKSFAHPTRISILKLLAPGERCVCELIEETDIEQSNLSQHLGVLRKQGLIGARKDGAKVIYTILHPSVLDIISIVEKTLSEQISQNQSLLTHLKKE